jgi:iron complex transport system ATP-binding protein
VAVTHDLNLALQFSDRVLLLEDGRVAGNGPPGEVLQPRVIERVFGVSAMLHGGVSGPAYLTYEVRGEAEQRREAQP